jgi:hypothetical protein
MYNRCNRREVDVCAPGFILELFDIHLNQLDPESPLRFARPQSMTFPPVVSKRLWRCIEDRADQIQCRPL